MTGNWHRVEIRCTLPVAGFQHVIVETENCLMKRVVTVEQAELLFLELDLNPDDTLQVMLNFLHDTEDMTPLLREQVADGR